MRLGLYLANQLPFPISEFRSLACISVIPEQLGFDGKHRIQLGDKRNVSEIVPRFALFVTYHYELIYIVLAV